MSCQFKYLIKGQFGWVVVHFLLPTLKSPIINKNRLKAAIADEMAEETDKMSLQLMSWYCWALSRYATNTFLAHWISGSTCKHTLYLSSLLDTQVSLAPTTASQLNPSYECGEGMKVKVVKWCLKKWNWPILMHTYDKKCEIMQKNQ